VPDADHGAPTELPRPPAAPDRPWSWSLTAPTWSDLPLALHRGHRRLPVGAELDLEVELGVEPDVEPDVEVRAPSPRRPRPIPVESLLEGAGFTPIGPVVAGGAGWRCRVVRRHTLADTIGPGMRLLVCGVNPSPYSADAGVGYARPGNRFWPAALAAGLVDVDRDPVAALARGMGMTDFAKRATRTAAEVTREEYRTGLARLTAVVRWLRPGAVCFVGLSGWRAVVDRDAGSGPQPACVADRPVYVMPSTSGLNARTSLDELARHLAAADALGSTPA